MYTAMVNGHKQFCFTEEDKKEIYDLFVNQNYSQRALMRKFGCTQKPMSRVLDELHLDHSRGNLSGYKYNYPDGIYSSEMERQIKIEIQKIPSKKQKYYINDYYFDNLRNPEVAYTLGLLFADGSNTKDLTSVNISLEEGDKSILEMIHYNIGYEKPIKFIDYSNKDDFGYSYKNQYALNIYNSRISKVLNVLGIVPCKSLVVEFPKWLHPSMYKHFIRGYYDGNGSLYRYYDKNGKARNTTLTITSTKQFCQAIMDISAQYIGIKSNIYNASNNNGITMVYSITGYNVCKKFCEWIYDDANIYLDRKYFRFCDYYNINDSIAI